MWTASFWRATAERAVRAFASTLISVWAVGSGVLDVRAVDWANSLSVAAGSALVSVLLSLVATTVGSPASPSFVSDPAAAAKPPAQPLVAAEEKVGGYPGGGIAGPPTTKASGTPWPGNTPPD